MRLGYIAQDVPLVQYAANKIAKLMSKPTVGGLNRLKRVARFLKAHPRWQTVYKEQEPVTTLTIRADSDWAQDAIDRKSVSSGHSLLGDHLIRALVATQTAPALSSGEAEFVASVKAGSVALGLRSMAKDSGHVVKLITIGTDSAAAKGVLGSRSWEDKRPRHWVFVDTISRGAESIQNPQRTRS